MPANQKMLWDGGKRKKRNQESKCIQIVRTIKKKKINGNQAKKNESTGPDLARRRKETIYTISIDPCTQILNTLTHAHNPVVQVFFVLVLVVASERVRYREASKAMGVGCVCVIAVSKQTIPECSSK